jgi:hypothetical protein
MLKAIYTNKTDYSETKTWEVQVVSFLIHSPQDMSRQYGKLAQQPCGVCVFNDGHIEVVPVSRLKVVSGPEQPWRDIGAKFEAAKPKSPEWFDPANAVFPAPAAPTVADPAVTSNMRTAFKLGVQWAYNNLLFMDSPMLGDAITGAAQAAYPDEDIGEWERHTVETGRKSGTTHKDVWPAGEGWEIDVDRGRVGTADAGWERFDNHEELYFRRRATGEA